jgi:rhodanese-related sulfurtransferase
LREQGVEAAALLGGFAAWTSGGNPVEKSAPN